MKEGVEREKKSKQAHTHTQLVSQFDHPTDGEMEGVPGVALIAGVLEDTGLVRLVVVFGSHQETAVVCHAHPPATLQRLFPGDPAVPRDEQVGFAEQRRIGVACGRKNKASTYTCLAFEISGHVRLQLRAG